MCVVAVIESWKRIEKAFAVSFGQELQYGIVRLFVGLNGFYKK